MKCYQCDMCKKIIEEKDLMFVTIEDEYDKSAHIAYNGHKMKVFDLCEECRDKIAEMVTGENHAL